MMSIEEIIKEYKDDKKNALDIDKLEYKYLSRKGYIAELFKGIKDIIPEKKSAYGQKLNELKQDIEKYVTKNKTKEKKIILKSIQSTH